MSCNAPMHHPDDQLTHADGTPVGQDDRTSRCTLPEDHYVLVEDSSHYDGHGCHADVLVHQSTIREVAHVAAEWPDGIHTCEELQKLEPGRRACTCGRCPR